jgi:hypothetical protein
VGFCPPHSDNLRAGVEEAPGCRCEAGTWAYPEHPVTSGISESLRKTTKLADDGLVAMRA